MNRINLIQLLAVLQLAGHLHGQIVVAPRQYITVGSVDVSWADMGTYTNFQLSVKQSSTMNVYAAIGLSNDREMSDDDVCACKFAKNLVRVERMYNSGSSPVYLNVTERTIGLSNQNMQMTDADNRKLICSFDRLKEMPNQKNYYSVKGKSYYLLVAYGATNDDGNLIYHGPGSRGSSSFMINFESVADTTTPSPSTSSNNLIDKFKDFYKNWLKWFGNFFG